jgi:hypothetical protein
MVTYYLAKDLSCFDVRIALHFFFSKLLNQGSVRVRYSSRFPVPGGLGLTEAACS